MRIEWLQFGLICNQLAKWENRFCHSVLLLLIAQAIIPCATVLTNAIHVDINGLPETAQRDKRNIRTASVDSKLCSSACSKSSSNPFRVTIGQLRVMHCVNLFRLWRRKEIILAVVSHKVFMFLLEALHADVTVLRMAANGRYLNAITNYWCPLNSFSL